MRERERESKRLEKPRHLCVTNPELSSLSHLTLDPLTARLKI